MWLQRRPRDMSFKQSQGPYITLHAPMYSKGTGDELGSAGTVQVPLHFVFPTFFVHLKLKAEPSSGTWLEMLLHG